MGYFGKIEDKLQAQKLRRKGLSYAEIRQFIKVSKSTLSEWCKNIPLTEKQQQRLIRKKIFGQRKGSIVAADNKRKKRIERTLKIQKEAKKFLGKVSKRDTFIAGIALYVAEGDKARDGHAGFSNADPRLIKFMMKWFLSFTKIPLKRMRGGIWLHEGLSEKQAKKFWSNLTGIPLWQFHKTYIAKNKKDSRKIRKNIHKYGVFSINFSDSDIHRQIMGWIYACFGDKIQ